MTLKVRRLNDEGVREFRAFHSEIYGNFSSKRAPTHLLDDENYSEPFTLLNGDNFSIDPNREFSSLSDIGSYLCEIFDSDDTRALVLEDLGLGSWLSLLYFDQICSKKNNGCWNPNEVGRYIPDLRPRRYYRHHIFNSIIMFSKHGQLSRILLYTPLSRLSEFSRYLSEQQEVILNTEMIRVVDTLYWDVDRGAPKVGAMGGSKQPHRDGTLRRFAGTNSFVFQYSPTWDFMEMSAEQILDMLPEEFDEWKS